MCISPAVTNPGVDGFANGMSGNPSMVFDTGPSSVLGNAYMQAETINAPARWNPFQEPTYWNNPPPLSLDGSAQRAHYADIGLVEFTPIGTGEIHDYDIMPTSQPIDQPDIAAWWTGLGQIYNTLGSYTATGSVQAGDGTYFGNTFTQYPIANVLPLPNLPSPDYNPSAIAGPFG